MPCSDLKETGSTVVKALQGRVKAEQDHFVAYYYFDFNNDIKRDPTRCIRAILKQVLFHNDAVTMPLQNLYSQCHTGRD